MLAAAPMHVISTSLSIPSMETTRQLQQTNTTTVVLVDGIQMVLSGVAPLSGTSLSTWAQTTINFISKAVGKVIQEQNAGYYKVSLNMSGISQDTTDTGSLLLEFSLAMSIQSSIEQHDGNAYVLSAFDTDTERFAYITALQDTNDTSFENITDVNVTITNTQPPTTGPTTSTTKEPTAQPTTIAPTESPTTIAPTEAPTTGSPPTESPTAHATESPTESPTEPPVQATTPEPTVSPTEAGPSPSPTKAPVESTPSPVEGNNTSAPSTAPVGSTTPAPAPTLQLQSYKAEGMVMTLTSMQPMTLEGISIWEDETAAFVRAEIQQQLSVEDNQVRVKIDVTSQEPPYGGRRLERHSTVRHLQQYSQNVTFDAIVTIRSSTEEPLDVSFYVLLAFDSPAEVASYIDVLQASEYSGFSDLTSVSVTKPVASNESPLKNDKAATIGISVGLVAVGVGLIGGIAFLVYSRRRQPKPSSMEPRSPESPLTAIMSADDAHDIHTGDEIEVGSRAEVSTLGDPIPPGMRIGDFIEGGTIFTAANDSLTTDYDFQKAFRSYQLSVADTVGTESEPSNLFPKDDSTLDEEYLHRNEFEVEAPAGLLGLVIDTSEDGYPTICAIKDTSCLAGQVQVGDILLSVDGMCYCVCIAYKNMLYPSLLTLLLLLRRRCDANDGEYSVAIDCIQERQFCAKICVYSVGRRGIVCSCTYNPKEDK